ncbi:MAG: hypothetical protein Kow0029_21260 [Candidatus Rifleibacteriota bacterium]
MIPEFFSSSAPVSFLIGGAGAGKTELALNLSVWQASRFKQVYLVDLDIVNPFFRVRKLTEQVEKKGVKIIFPDSRVAGGDIPGLPAAAWGAVENPEFTVVCDIGGGEPGLRPLGRMKDLARQRNANVFFVINPYRPGFSSLGEIEESFVHMSNLSAMKATHIVANPNLSGETSQDVFSEGFALIESFSRKIGVKIAFAVADAPLAEQLKNGSLSTPEFFKWNDSLLFAIRRYWDVPWQFGDVANY